jgi:hypothetical protein
VIGAAAGAPATLYFSHTLLKLSGSALWLPPEWRRSIEVLATLLGTTIFAWLLHASSGPFPAAELDGNKPAEVVGQVHLSRQGSRQRRFGLALAWIAGFAVFLSAYMMLRGACVYPFSRYAEWRDQEAKMEAAAARRGEKPTSQPIPQFIDTERGELFLPLWFPPEQREYFTRMRDEHFQDGLMYVLDHEPDRIIDWLREDRACRLRLNVTALLFLLLHLGIVVCFAAGAGYACLIGAATYLAPRGP